jgi:dTDP-4-dehydrorhamnose reductase
LDLIEIMKKALIIGANGTIGTSIANEFKKEGIVFDGTFSNTIHKTFFHFNLADEDTQINYSDYSRVIICAGIAGKNVELSPDLAQQININGTIRLIDRVHEAGGQVTFISSSAVFSAKQQSSNETSIPSPKTLYGKHKLRVEEYLLDPSVSCFNPSIIRPTKVLSGKKGLIKSWLDDRIFTTNKAVTLSPISDIFLAKLVTEIHVGNEIGIFHVSGQDILNYVEFAERLILETGTSPKEKNTIEDYSQLPDSATHLTTSQEMSNLNLIQTLDEFFKDILFH